MIAKVMKTKMKTRMMINVIIVYTFNLSLYLPPLIVFCAWALDTSDCKDYRTASRVIQSINCRVYDVLWPVKDITFSRALPSLVNSLRTVRNV